MAHGGLNEHGPHNNFPPPLSLPSPAKEFQKKNCTQKGLRINFHWEEEGELDEGKNSSEGPERFSEKPTKKERGINTRLWPMTLTHVVWPNKYWDQLSNSHPTAKIQTSSLTAIWRSRAIIIMAPILRSWNSRLWDVDLSNRSDGCMRNQKGYLKYMCGLMTEELETQTMPIAFITPRGQKIWIDQNLQGMVATSLLASKLSGEDWDTGGQMLYALPTWQDTS